MHIRRRRHGVRSAAMRRFAAEHARSPCPFPDVHRQGAQLALERTWKNHPRGRIPADLLRPHRRHADLRRVWSLSSTRALPTTRCCVPSTPSRTSAQLPTACGCFSSSTGAAPPPTPTSADTLGCGMRHAPYRVDALARDQWLLHMRAAVDSLAARRRPRCRAVELPVDGRPLAGQHSDEQNAPGVVSPEL